MLIFSIQQKENSWKFCTSMTTANNILDRLVAENNIWCHARLFPEKVHIVNNVIKGADKDIVDSTKFPIVKTAQHFF